MSDCYPHPLLTLNNGVALPALGLGVYLIPPEETAAAVRAAIGIGYRLIDTAPLYLNEREVGEGIAQSGIAREQIVIQTKLWMADYGYERALRAFTNSRRQLGVEYVDLYLLHWPTPANFDLTIASYRAAERLLADGRVRAIGVCNFNATHMAILRARTHIVPAVNQVELHPLFIQRELRDAHTRSGIVTQSWSPLGGVNVYTQPTPHGARNPVEHPVVRAIAAQHGKTPAQVILRWHLEHGLSAIPKSVRVERMSENFAVFDFALTADEVASIDALDTGVRGGPDPDTADCQLAPLSDRGPHAVGATAERR